MTLPDAIVACFAIVGLVIVICVAIIGLSIIKKDK
jgi:hypothetical protein